MKITFAVDSLPAQPHEYEAGRFTSGFRVLGAAYGDAGQEFWDFEIRHLYHHDEDSALPDTGAFVRALLSGVEGSLAASGIVPDDRNDEVSVGPWNRRYYFAADIADRADLRAKFQGEFLGRVNAVITTALNAAADAMESGDDPVGAVEVAVDAMLDAEAGRPDPMTAST